MGVNLVPEIDGFQIRKQNFHRDVPDAPLGSVTDGSIEDGCITEGQHRVLRFNLHCKNIGDKPLKIGNPADRPDIFERSEIHGFIMKDNFNVYTLKNNNGVEVKGFKRPFCLESGVDFTCDNQGIGVNEDDHYTSNLPCQFVILDDFPDGECTLEATTNATSVMAAKDKNGKILFEEDNYDDNTVKVNLRIHGNIVTVI
jgi:hypothetical protein